MRSRSLTPPLLSALALAACFACDSGGPHSGATKGEATAKSAQPDEVDEAPPPTVGEAASAEAGPSSEASQSWAQRWATPTGQPTGHLAGVRGAHVYVIAGPFMEHGTPATQLVCLAADSGELLWTHADDQPLSLDGASDKLVDVGREDGILILDANTGKKTRPTKADSDATTPIGEGPEAPGCAIAGDRLSCAGWAVTEAGSLSALRGAGERVCYAVAGAREVRCREAASGDLVFAVAVPAVPGVKEPDAANFSFEIVADQLFVANYDGMVHAYGPE